MLMFAFTTNTCFFLFLVKNGLGWLPHLLPSPQNKQWPLMCLLHICVILWSEYRRVNLVQRKRSVSRIFWIPGESSMKLFIAKRKM